MLISALGEGYSLRLAANTLRDGAKLRSISFWKYLRSGQDPTVSFSSSNLPLSRLGAFVVVVVVVVVLVPSVLSVLGRE